MKITIFVEKNILKDLVSFLLNGVQDESSVIRGKWHLSYEKDTIEMLVSYDQYIILADNE